MRRFGGWNGLAERTGATVALCALSVAIVSCSGGDKSSTDPGPTPGGGGSNSTNVTLTLTTKSLDAGFIPGVIYAYTADAGEVQRSRMPALLDENNAYVKPFAQTSRTVTLLVPKGKTVTLFAAEFGVYNSNAKQAGQPLSKVPMPDGTEFTGWSGASGRLVAGERGVTYIKMDSDADVTAEFRKLEGFTVQYQGCPLVDVGAAAPPPLGFGITQSQSYAPIGAYHAVSASDEDWFYLYGRQGTVYTLVAKQRDTRTASVSTAGHLNWAGAVTGSCGGALTCTVTVPATGSAAILVNSRNSWITFSATNALGCGDCAAGQPCTIRP